MPRANSKSHIAILELHDGKFGDDGDMLAFGQGDEALLQNLPAACHGHKRVQGANIDEKRI